MVLCMASGSWDMDRERRHRRSLRGKMIAEKAPCGLGCCQIASSPVAVKFIEGIALIGMVGSLMLFHGKNLQGYGFDLRRVSLVPTIRRRSDYSGASIIGA